MTAFSSCLQIILALTLVTHVVQGQEQGRKNDAAKAEVKYSELTRSTQIISDLGYPLGQILTIRGIWQESHLKSGLMVFHVTEIEGKSTKDRIDIVDEDIKPLAFNGKNEPNNMKEKWDWSAAWNVKKEPPKFDIGEQWEMRVFAGGEIRGFPFAVYKELGLGATVQDPYGGHFYPTYYFISARRIKESHK